MYRMVIASNIPQGVVIASNTPQGVAFDEQHSTLATQLNCRGLTVACRQGTRRRQGVQQRHKGGEGGAMCPTKAVIVMRHCASPASHQMERLLELALQQLPRQLRDGQRHLAEGGAAAGVLVGASLAHKPQGH